MANTSLIVQLCLSIHFVFGIFPSEAQATNRCLNIFSAKQSTSATKEFISEMLESSLSDPALEAQAFEALIDLYLTTDNRYQALYIIEGMGLLYRNSQSNEVKQKAYKWLKLTAAWSRRPLIKEAAQRALDIQRPHRQD